MKDSWENPWASWHRHCFTPVITAEKAENKHRTISGIRKSAIFG